jgi:hypothetical protein
MYITLWTMALGDESGLTSHRWLRFITMEFAQTVIPSGVWHNTSRLVSGIEQRTECLGAITPLTYGKSAAVIAGLILRHESFDRAGKSASTTR